MTFLWVAAVIGLIPAVIANRKGHNFGMWWLFGAGLFIVALPAAILVKPDAKVMPPCPWCRTPIDREASVCPQCGRDVAAPEAVET